MFQQISLLIFSVTLINSISAESPCGDWIKYQDEKCFKVFSSVTTQIEAGSICQKENASIGFIRSAEEQNTIYNYLKNNHVVDNVWIGIKRKGQFKSSDGSVLNYTNWNMGRPLNVPGDGNDCVEMSVDYQGKWIDVKCEKKNAVLCEKNQPWSSAKIEQTIHQLRAELDQLKQKEGQSNSVPIGFIYVQLMGQSDPQTLWPQTQWENVSKNYSGLFFRAEGGGSNTYGQVQEQQTQSLEVVNEMCGNVCYFDKLHHKPTKVMESFPQLALWTGNMDGGGMGLKFKHNIEEIRPRNQAIRIWKRIK